MPSVKCQENPTERIRSSKWWTCLLPCLLPCLIPIITQNTQPRRCICATRPNWSRSTVWETTTCRIAQLTRSCMTNMKLTGMALAFYHRLCTCASSLHASAICAATCRSPATTSKANSLKAIEKAIDFAPNARRIFAKPFIKHSRPFGGSGWHMNSLKMTPMPVFVFPFGCIGRAAMNPANRTAPILGGRSDTHGGSLVHGFHKNQCTNT